VGQSEPIAVPLDARVRDELKQRVKDAEAAGVSTIAWTAVSAEPVPLADAKSVLDTLEAALADVAAGTFDPEGGGKGKAERDETGEQQPSRGESLIIKANIQSVDYEEARRVALEVPEDLQPDLPSTLRHGIDLKEHQLKGVTWLQHLRKQCPRHCRGALLADDMGLGKTLQVLVTLAAAFERDPALPPALIVAPVSLLDNWKEEVHKFFQDEALPVLTAYGGHLASLRAARSEIDAQLQGRGLVRFLRPRWRDNARIVLTTYETLRDLEFSFASEKWSVMVCDEAQKVKNPNALVTRAVKKQNAQFKIACTGTPVENTLADLWCLFDFVQPGFLGALNDFAHRYRRPIEARTEEEKARVDELREKIRLQVLRRLKKDVAKDLPQKVVVDHCGKLPLSAYQRALYGRAVDLFKQAGQPGTPFKNVLGLLHHLRLLCTDPKPLGLTAFLAEPLEAYQAKSPKLQWLLDTLKVIETRGEKVLVFCEFRDVQRMLRHYINEVFGVAPDIINGDTPASASHNASRHKRIKAFQGRPGFAVIILSPLAVGFGVNIQAANHVVHYTRTWNPAKEDQATDRAYRIGQDRDVYVYCPVVAAEDFKTFDVRLHELLDHKRRLADDMLNGSGDLTPQDFDPRDIAPPDAVSSLHEPLTVEHVLRMDARHFEGFVAALWQKKGFQWVQRTPDSGDDGVDVVAITGRTGELVQCKSSTVAGESVDWDAVKEVVAGEAAYKARHPDVAFAKACATNQFFKEHAVRHAALNNVALYDQRDLTQLLQETPITMIDVERYVYARWADAA
jgi:SNF2 family DNA or RNA helicase